MRDVCTSEKLKAEAVYPRVERNAECGIKGVNALGASYRTFQPVNKQLVSVCLKRGFES